MPSFRATLLALALLALVPASASAKVRQVRSVATVTNASGAPVSGWKLGVKLARGTRLKHTSGAKPSARQGRVTLTPTKRKTLAPGAKARVLLMVKGTKPPAKWRVGTNACTARARKRQGRTARQVVSCVIGGGTQTAGDNWFRFAPYADLTLPATPSLDEARSESGASHFTLAFVTAASGGANCTPTWGGTAAATGADPLRKDQVDALRAAGGDVVASFGGAAGTELAIACTDPAELAAAYGRVVDAYALTHIDFDIEGAAIANDDANRRRNTAIAQLQRDAAAAGRTLRVGFTVETLPTGMSDDTVAILQDAIDRGVDISLVNVMAMDYGDANAPDGGTKMGDYAIRAGDAAAAKLATLLPSLSDDDVRRRVGVTAMIGVNDVQSEVFGLADADEVAQWASARHAGMLSMWSLARDRSCSGSPSGAQADCSGVAQQPWDFAKKLAAFTG